MLKIKLFVIVVVISLVSIISSTSYQFSSKAESDAIIGEIAAYRTWAKVTKEPLGFQIDGASGSEWTFVIDGQEVVNFGSSLPGSESKKKQKDLVGVVSDIGRGLWKALNLAQKAETNIETTDVTHEVFTFAVIYANELAKVVIEKEIANFPVGTILVREKRETATSKTPQSIIAMVKRENGFSKETND